MHLFVFSCQIVALRDGRVQEDFFQAKLERKKENIKKKRIENQEKQKTSFTVTLNFANYYCFKV